jgi:hypothetical protein
MSMAGFIIAKLFYKANNWVWYKGILTCVGGTSPDGTTLIWGRPNAQTLGWVQIYDTADNRTLNDLRVHENTHVVQAFIGGLIGQVLVPLLFIFLGWSPLLGVILGGLIGGIGFNLVYVILFVYLYLKIGDKDWFSAYRNNPFEVQAYDSQDKYIANPDTRPWGV